MRQVRVSRNYHFPTTLSASQTQTNTNRHSTTQRCHLLHLRHQFSVPIEVSEMGFMLWETHLRDQPFTLELPG